jgi:hypothetical protein
MSLYTSQASQTTYPTCSLEITPRRLSKRNSSKFNRASTGPHFNYRAFHPKAPLKQIISNRPWQLVGIDVTGPFKKSNSGNEYIIVAEDHFSKFCVTKAVYSFSAEITAKFIFDDVICRFGPVEQILTTASTSNQNY